MATTIKVSDLVTRCKDICDTVYNEGEVFVVSRPHNENVVVMSETWYKELEKIRNNAEYLAKLDLSIAQAEKGEVTGYSMTELREMEK